MADQSILPFDIGTTAGVTATTDKPEYEGKEYLVEDLDYSVSPPKPRAYYGSAGGMRYKRIRVVRNNSGVAILPRQLCMYSSTAYSQQVTGLQRLTALEGRPADEFLPAAGCPDKDLFYITIEGGAECLTDLAAGANNVLVASTVGQQQWCVALTAVTSQCTTAGRIAPQDTSGVTTALANQIQNRIGLVLSAMTTTQTNAAVLVYVKAW